MKVKLAGDGVEGSVKAQKGVEGAHEMVVLSVGERPENALRRLADVALRPTEHEAQRAEVLEERHVAPAVEGATDDRRLLSLQQRKVRAGGAALGTSDPGRQGVVAGRRGHLGTKVLGVRARVERRVELAHRGRDVRARTNDTRARRERGEREPQTRRRLGVDRRERNCQIRACPARGSVSPDNEEGLPVREAFLEVRLSESR